MDHQSDILTLPRRMGKSLPWELVFEIVDYIKVDLLPIATNSMYVVMEALPPSLLDYSPEVKSQLQQHLDNKTRLENNGLTFICFLFPTTVIMDLLGQATHMALQFDAIRLEDHPTDMVTGNVAKHVTSVPIKWLIRKLEHCKDYSGPINITPADQSQLEMFLRNVVRYMRPHEGFLPALNLRYLIPKNEILNIERGHKFTQWFNSGTYRWTKIHMELVLEPGHSDEDLQLVESILERLSKDWHKITISKATKQEEALFVENEKNEHVEE